MVRRLSLTKKQRPNTDVVYLVGRDGFVLTSAKRCQPDRRTCNDVVRHRSSMVRKLSLTKNNAQTQTLLILVGRDGFVLTSVKLRQPDRRARGDAVRHRSSMVRKLSLTKKTTPKHRRCLSWWAGMDSNHRRHSRRIYSPLHLAALQPTQNEEFF